MEVKAVLFDTRSIQKYIYASNKLRTNIGASYIVEHLFDGFLQEVIDKKFGKGTNICQIAYTGGGNALVYIDKEGTPEGIQRELVKDFSTELLVKYPGLHIGASVGELDTENDFQAGLSELYRKLKESQGNFAPMTNVPYTGFTLLSDQDGEVANAYYDKLPGRESRFCSQEAMSKLEASDEANKALHEKFNDVFAKNPDVKYEFPTELDKLGQKEGEDYIAVIHIDGNNMGKKFEACNGLKARQKLSGDIKQKTERSFAKLLQSIIDDVKNEIYGDSLNTRIKNGKCILPVRPLILGGDDVTFICPAKVALAYSKRFMEFMLEKDADLEPTAQSIDSCAGIAILPTAYPFFRGYTLAEQLCDAAKKEMRKLGREEGSCWLDFIMLHGEQAPTLRQILAQEHRAVKGCTHFGPYRVAHTEKDKSKDHRHDVEKLIACAKFFKNTGGSAIANNKVKELRRVLQLGDDTIDNYLQQLGHQGKKLPDIPSWESYKENLWSGGETPYIDAIEIMDYLEGVEGDE